MRSYGFASGLPSREHTSVRNICEDMVENTGGEPY